MTPVDPRAAEQAVGTRPFAPFEWLRRFVICAPGAEGFISVIAGFSFIGIMLGVADSHHRALGDERLPQGAVDKIVGVNGHTSSSPPSISPSPTFPKPQAQGRSISPHVRRRMPSAGCRS
jgi:lipoprotein-releasing system permease protein